MPNLEVAPPRISAHLKGRKKLISAQPRISAHLSSSQSNANKRSPPPHPLEWINFNKRLPRGRSFLQSILQKHCFVTSSSFVIRVFRFSGSSSHFSEMWNWPHYTVKGHLDFFRYRVFSHDVTAAILVSKNNATAAMLVSQTSHVGVELFSYANVFSCSNKFA